MGVPQQEANSVELDKNPCSVAGTLRVGAATSALGLNQRHN